MAGAFPGIKAVQVVHVDRGDKQVKCRTALVVERKMQGTDAAGTGSCGSVEFYRLFFYPMTYRKGKAVLRLPGRKAFTKPFASGFDEVNAFVFVKVALVVAVTFPVGGCA